MRCVLGGILVLSTRVDGGCAGMGWTVWVWLRTDVGSWAIERLDLIVDLIGEVVGDCCQRWVHRIHEGMNRDEVFMSEERW